MVTGCRFASRFPISGMLAVTESIQNQWLHHPLHLQVAKHGTHVRVNLSQFKIALLNSMNCSYLSCIKIKHALLESDFNLYKNKTNWNTMPPNKLTNIIQIELKIIYYWRHARNSLP